MIYVILAHNAPHALGMLVKRLQGGNNYFVIHIDKNHNIEPFKEVLSGMVNCYFTPQRFECYWGSFKLIEATLHAFDFIRINLKKKQRIILLSGSDFPIKSNVYIQEYLKSHEDTIFIEFNKIPRKLWKRNNGDGGKGRFPFYDKVKERIDLYAGSQWFSVPYKVLPIINSFLKVNPSFLEYFKLVHILDESFFQTLFLNCDHPYIKKNLRNHNLHLIKWDKPYFHPRVLKVANLNQIIKSKNLFARKFDPIKSKELLNLLGGVNETNDKPDRIAVLYLTDKLDKYKGRYAKLKKEAIDADVYCVITYERSHADSTEVFLHKHSCVTDLGYVPLNKEQIVPGSTFFAVLNFFTAKPYYDYYWLIEDDVWYNGDWMNFFLRFANLSIDYIYRIHRHNDAARNWQLQVDTENEIKQKPEFRCVFG